MFNNSLPRFFLYIDTIYNMIRLYVIGVFMISVNCAFAKLCIHIYMYSQLNLNNSHKMIANPSVCICIHDCKIYSILVSLGKEKLSLERRLYMFYNNCIFVVVPNVSQMYSYYVYILYAAKIKAVEAPCIQSNHVTHSIKTGPGRYCCQLSSHSSCLSNNVGAYSAAIPHKISYRVLIILAG